MNDRCWSRGLANTELDAAAADCRGAIERAPKNASYVDSLALVLFRMGDLADSLASYDSALAMSPDQVSSLYMRGIVKLRLGRTEEGRADVAAALAAEPDIADFYGEFGLSP